MKTLKKTLPALVKFLTTLTKQDPPDAAIGEAKILLYSINFELLLCLEMKTPVFLETACASSDLQKEDLDLGAEYDIVCGIVTRLRDLRTEEEFKSIYERATSHAEAAGIDVPDVIPGHGRRRKIPAKLMQCSKSATEDHEPRTLEEFYRVRLFYTFLDVCLQELQKQFEGKENPKMQVMTNKIIKSLHTLTDATKWKGVLDDEAK